MNRRDSQAAILREVERYHIARLDLLITQFPGIDVPAVVRKLIALRRLRRERHLSGLEYVLLPRRKPPAAASIARALAMHTVCAESAGTRQLLNKFDFQRYFQTIFSAGLPRGYCVDLQGDTPTLSHLRVDVQPEPVRHIVAHTHRLIHRHRPLAGFRSLMASGQFEITFLVATASKSRILQHALQSLTHTGVKLHAEHVPVLLDLLAPLSGEPLADTLHSSNSIPDVVGLKRLSARERH